MCVYMFVCICVHVHTCTQILHICMYALCMYIHKHLDQYVVINWADENPDQQLGSFYVFLTWVSISVGLVSVVAFLVAFIEVSLLQNVVEV